MRASSESTAKLRVNLSSSHRKWIREILADSRPHPGVTQRQRSAIRDLCGQVRHLGEGEQVLNALNVALVEAANQERIPYGPDRNELLAALVSLFAEEFFSATPARVSRAREGGSVAPDVKSDVALKTIRRRSLIDCSTRA
jgi:hypothetical protein